MQQWEYLQVLYRIGTGLMAGKLRNEVIIVQDGKYAKYEGEEADNYLAWLGSEGWELVAVSHMYEKPPRLLGDPPELLWFKRPRPVEDSPITN